MMNKNKKKEEIDRRAKINPSNTIQNPNITMKTFTEKETKGSFLSGMPLISVVTNAICMLQHKKILWMGPKDGEKTSTQGHGDGNDVNHVELIKNFFTRVSSSFECTITYVESSQEAIKFIKKNKYDIIISNYGEQTKDIKDQQNQKNRNQHQQRKQEAPPTVISILKFLRSLEWDNEHLCPVVVYAEESQESGKGMFNRRRKQLLAMGAHDYCIHITALIKSIHRILKPLS